MPQLRSTQVKDKAVQNNSQVKTKKTKVEDHHRISSFSNKTTSVTACNDSLMSRTLYFNVVCVTCGNCVFNLNQDACVSKFINDVNTRNKKPKVVPISARKPKRHVKQSVATPHKKTVTSESTIQKSKSYFRMLYENTNADLEVAFRKSTCFVRDLQGNDLLIGNGGSNLYTISLQETSSPTPISFMVKASPTAAWLWHRRLSHLNFDTINLISKKDIINGLPQFKYVKDQLCSSCELDLCGPMRIESINGNKYILVIVDDYSRYTWTHFLRSKDETPENGIVERRNRTLVEAARTMLSASKLPLFFWAKAIATACYAQNISLIIPRHEKTPCHIINDMKPTLKHLHIFGYTCYLTRDDENLDKIKEKGDPLDKTDISLQELDLLFSPLFEEYFSIGNQNVSKSFALSDNLQQQDTQPTLNIQPTLEPTTPTTNVNTGEDQATDAQFEPYKFINPFCTPTRRQLATDPEICMFTLIVSTTEPYNIKEAMADHAWIEAMQEELHHFDKLKARLVAKGYAQEEDGLETAFLNGLKEEVYINQPDGFVDPDHPQKVYRLRKALYGLKQAPRAWYDELSTFPMSKGFTKVEAEYVALSASCTRVMWMRTQLKDYGFDYNKISLYCDSQYAIAMSCNPVQHFHTKHINVCYHFIKEQVERSIIELYFVRTEYQLADMFTKALSQDRFAYLVRQLGMRCLTLVELEVLKRLLSDEVISRARVLNEAGDGFTFSRAIGETKCTHDGLLNETQLAAAAESKEFHSFKIDPTQVENVKKICLQNALNYPLLEEYDFHNVTVEQGPISRLISSSCGQTFLMNVLVSLHLIANKMFCGDAGVVVTTYNMLAFGGFGSQESKKIIEEIRNREWGLLLMDEVHVVPAPTVRKVISIVKSHYKLGLTRMHLTTLVREDEKITDLNVLIGLKLYEANRMDLVRGWYITNVQCAEVRCPMTKEFFAEYLKKENFKKKKQERGDKIIVLSDNIFALKKYVKKLHKPMVHRGIRRYDQIEAVPWSNERPLDNKELNAIIGAWFTLWRD
ncbi:retrovirus-related pol polyprotein from transposon TNT 1-94 [Tanacetum coccineum]